MPEDNFSKKNFWVDQGPIDKIGKAARLPEFYTIFCSRSSSRPVIAQ